MINMMNTMMKNKNTDVNKQKDMNKLKELNKEKTIIAKINDVFKLPIQYNKDKQPIKENIITDLELINTIDASTEPIYSFYFNNKNDISKKITEQITENYTTDTMYLKETQKLIQEYKPDVERYSTYENIIDIWNELKISNGFKEKYGYIDWEMLEFLNKSETFLQFLSMYNLFSPIVSFLIPIIILIIPFLILHMKGLQISLQEYVDVLKIVAQSNAIGKFCTADFSTMNFQEGSYVFASFIFYLFSIYQNIMICIRFNNNMKKIHDYFTEIKMYLNKTITSMDHYLQISKKYASQKNFNDVMETKYTILKEMHNKLSSISDYNILYISKLKEMGSVFKYFYELHSEKEYEEAILYSFGFNGYMDCLEGLQQNILERKINYATFYKHKNNRKNVFKNNYYASIKNNPVKNNIHFKKNIIITGPNASGKTTVLKSTLINIILTQQFGCGFYDSAKYQPFKYIHCYLNIPDTSGRDSLFQAEARRCKEIIDFINEYSDDTHFCVFDELYSGTNPEEAEQSAVSFMLYLQKYKKITSFLTTHFVNICKKLNQTKTIQNRKMKTEFQNNKLIYKYKLENGISEIKGGINILTELNYPKEIINNSLVQ